MRSISSSAFNKRWIGPLLAYIFGISSLSQAQTTQALKIGDKVPELFFSQMLNFNQSTAKISQFKGHPIIIDFWATWCTACINNFRHLDSLNKVFNGKVQFLLIDSKNTGDTKQRVVDLLQKLRTGDSKLDFSIPTAVGDSVADKIFEHRMIPHYVWIDADGTLQYITASEEVNYVNINHFLNKDKITVHFKRDIFDFNPEAPLFFPSKDSNSPVIKSRVMITGYAEGLAAMSGGFRDSCGRYIRLFSTNSPPMILYAQALPELATTNPNQIIYKLNNPSTFKNDDWSERVQNYFCFEIITPPTSLNSIRTRMKSALDDYFDVQSFFQEQLTTCYAIRNPQQLDSINLDKLVAKAIFPDSNQIHFNNASMEDIVGHMNYYSTVPVINQTGIDQHINFILPRGDLNLKNLRAYLEKFGLRLDIIQQKIRVFVIQQKSENN